MKKIIISSFLSLLLITFSLFFNQNSMIDTVAAATAQSSNNYLSNLTSNVAPINFVKTTQSYNVTVDNSITTLNLVATKDDSSATVLIMADANFIVATNTVTIRVTAQNGAVRNYYVYVNRLPVPKSTDNDLKTITSDVIDIAFDKKTTVYNLEVAYDVTSLNLQATTNDSNASAVIVGDTDFVVGSNVVTINVTAENGSVKTYTVNVNRQKESKTNYILPIIIGSGVLLGSVAITFFIKRKK